jgi:hypothetical protein
MVPGRLVKSARKPVAVVLRSSGLERSSGSGAICTARRSTQMGQSRRFGRGSAALPSMTEHSQRRSACLAVRFAAERPFANSDIPARKLFEIEIGKSETGPVRRHFFRASPQRQKRKCKF